MERFVRNAKPVLNIIVQSHCRGGVSPPAANECKVYKMISKDKYLIDPCRASSIPYWKAKSITIPEGMVILHHDEYDESKYHKYTDEPYFRLIHDLQNLSAPMLPQGYSLFEATLSDFVAHINSCYESMGISDSELKTYAARPVYDASLWISVRDDQIGKIIATGIAELDREIGEGVLEWIQVSKDARFLSFREGETEIGGVATVPDQRNKGYCKTLLSENVRKNPEGTFLRESA